MVVSKYNFNNAFKLCERAKLTIGKQKQQGIATKVIGLPPITAVLLK